MGGKPCNISSKLPMPRWLSFRLTAKRRCGARFDGRRRWLYDQTVFQCRGCRQGKICSAPLGKTWRNGADYLPSYRTDHRFRFARSLFTQQESHPYPKEFAVLVTLAKQAPEIVRYQAISQSVWGENTTDAHNRTKYLVYLIRKKLHNIAPDITLLAKCRPDWL